MAKPLTTLFTLAFITFLGGVLLFLLYTLFGSRGAYFGIAGILLMIFLSLSYVVNYHRP